MEKANNDAQIQTERETKEAGAPLTSPDATQQKDKLQKAPEKLQPKLPRLQIMERGLKGTSWKVTKVDTAPSYKRITAGGFEVMIAALDDKKLAEKGIRKLYDKEGVFKGAEGVDNVSHKMTLDVGGASFMNRLPNDTRKFVESAVGNKGLAALEIYIDDNGVIDVSRLKFKMSDALRNLDPNEVNRVEREIMDILTAKKELSPDANIFKKVEEKISDLCLFLGKVQLDRKGSEAYDKGVTNDITRVTNRWVELVRTTYADSLKGSSIHKIESTGKGYGVSVKLDSGSTLELYLDLASGTIGEFKLIGKKPATPRTSPRTSVGLIPDAERKNPADAAKAEEAKRGELSLLEKLSPFVGKKISEETLGDIGTTLSRANMMDYDKGRDH